MNAQDRHTAAAAKINDLERRFDKLFNKCQAECEGMSIDDANKVWRLKYKSRYDAMDRLLDAAFICLWYTDPTNSLHNKQVNHRATVSKMRSAGLHRIATVKK